MDALKEAANRYGQFLAREPDIAIHRPSR
jgi:hypothetical protein